MDEIRVKNLEVFCHHGVYKEENVLGQKFLVNIVSKVDTRAAGKTDGCIFKMGTSCVTWNIKKVCDWSCVKSSC